MVEVSPFLGWRHARLLADVFSVGGVVELSAVRFGALVWDSTFGRQVTAECFNPVAAKAVEQGLVDEVHAAPDPDCSCGLYALKDRAAVVDRNYSGYSTTLNQGLLEVACHGTVFEGVLGFRSQHQTVVSVTLPDRCVVCLNGKVSRFLIPLPNTAVGLMVNQPLLPACGGDHELLGAAAFHSFTLEDVSRLLDVPVATSPDVAVVDFEPMSAWLGNLLRRLKHSINGQ